MWFERYGIRRLLDTDSGSAGGGSAEEASEKQDSSESPEVKDFDAWLKDQPETVKQAVAKEEEGLRSALQAERKRAKDAEKALKEQQAAKEKAEEAALEDQQKFKELSEQRGAKLDELQQQVQALATERDALKARAEAAEQALGAQNQKVLEKVPDHIKALLEGKSPVEVGEFLTKHQETLLKSVAGTPASPKPGGKDGELSEEEMRKRTARTWA
jgi:septal ring factor EnvC (AmiA/AmiB activator)